MPVGSIRPNPDQPRRRFDAAALQSLADSVSEQGIVQPLVVRPLPAGDYELVAGERRWRAATAAGLDTVPCVVREDDETARLAAAVVENMVREDLTPVEAARGCAALTEELGLSREEVGRRVGRGRVAVSNLIRLLDLPDAVLDLLDAGRLSEGHGRAILQAEGHTTRLALAQEAVKGGWTVRETERRARATGGPETARRPGRRGPRDPDVAAAAAEIEDALGSALGAEVRVRATGTGAVAEIRCGTLEELGEISRRAASSRR